VRIVITEDSIEVRLSTWQKVLGLLRNITVPLSAVADVQLVEDPLREAMATGTKVGLRLPWLYYVARTIRLDQAFVVRRGVPGISFSVTNGGTLTRVLLSTPEAPALVERLRGA